MWVGLANVAFDFSPNVILWLRAGVGWDPFLVFRGRWGGRLLQTIYASCGRRGQLLVGSPWCGTRWGRQHSCCFFFFH